jgi:hypothetical protein
MACEKSRYVTEWQQRFVAMLPSIVRCLGMAFRTLTPEHKSEVIQEGVANTYVAYSQLVKRGRENLAFATVLARFAVSQIRAGRRVGGKLNSSDLSSPYAQKRKNFKLGRLDRYDSRNECWQEVLLADDRRPILDQVAFRCDFPEWLRTLPPRDRKIAKSLAKGESTSQAARRFGLTLGRVSQLRRELERSWLAFHGEEAESERMELLAAA